MTPVLALGVGAVTAAGCVWYVPALVDLRAGADRPASRRLRAAACVTGWATAALAVPLILAGLPAPLLLAVAVAGATASATVRARAAVRHGREERETAACWAALDTPPPAPPARPGRRAKGPNGPGRGGPFGPPAGPDGGGGAVRD
ncbi:hypothetical protein [Streptomyces showdoensis]|uniref:hypothetical protein n=1 Tax=Streptomyces showdoensis TaxID=68268 RepID=UPI000F4D91E0|nr:hypothetical protein [Streptomyces showdoensis]